MAHTERNPRAWIDWIEGFDPSRDGALSDPGKKYRKRQGNRYSRREWLSNGERRAFG